MDTMMKHMDCRNFAALDVAQGICHRTRELVLADDDHCEHCVPMPKCKLCSHFTESEQCLGLCNAVHSKPVTYPDLIAVTCDMFAGTDSGPKS